MEWYAVCVLPGKDERAANNLREKGFEVFWPFFVELIQATKKRKAYFIRKAVFTGYLFVQCDIEEVWKVEDTNSVARVICNNESFPVKIPETVIEKVKKKCDPFGEYIVKKSRVGRRRFKRGDKIRPLDIENPFFGYVFTVIKELDNGSISAIMADENQMRVEINNAHRWESDTAPQKKP